MNSIELFLSVPMGLEDVAVRKLPPFLCQVASSIRYSLGSGYLILLFPSIDSEQNNQNNHHEDTIKALSDLVLHPPLCIFSAHISLGNIEVPRSIFNDAAKLLAFTKQDIGFKSVLSQQPAASASIPATTVSMETYTKRPPLNWDESLAVLKIVSSSSFSDRMDHSDTISGIGSSKEQATMDPIRFRATFDRGDVQHKGVRSQDLAAGLGSLTGARFPQWKVNLTDFDVEVIGRWIQDVEENGYIFVKGKDKITAEASSLKNIGKKRTRDEPVEIEVSPEAAVDVIQKSDIIQEGSKDTKRMQVGITLPLAFSTCPYRFRPKDGRTSLRMEIAYNLIGFANPRPGDVVVDTCAGVGTIPIVGAAHYPACLFVGCEILELNVEKANENERVMMERIDQIQQKRSTENKAGRSHSRPGLILGDAKAVCLRSNSVDLIISDLPWGQRESSHLSNCKLYPRLIKEIIRMLRTNGRAVLVTGERKLLQRQLDAPFARPYLKLIHKREITIGFKVVVFELVRL
ncbi:THUMP domain-containing protein 3 [Gryganskiella cystojenkinii]|nr:THUMP domain-containing protein 3 [Gryganskiella cystojenkinii]